MSIPTTVPLTLSRDVSEETVETLKDCASIHASTLETLRVQIKKGDIDQCIIHGKRNSRNDTSYYLVFRDKTLLQIYETQRGLGPRVWRRFETVINFIQDTFGARLPLSSICIIIEKPL